jgi:predicted NUDIX family NTP pyrophosphohydrolase
MQKTSAGILLYRKAENGVVETLLVHMGGPFFARKDDGSWSIPKGETDGDEDFLATAKREFNEETGFAVPSGTFLPLGSVEQKSGKIVHAWAIEGDCDPTKLISNTFSMEWPPRSGKQQSFPEIDRGEFFTTATARQKINPAQIPFLERLEKSLD